MSEVEGKCCGDVWHGTGRLTVFVNQPPAHAQFPLSGCDKHDTLSHTVTLRSAGCMWSVLCRGLVQSFIGSGSEKGYIW